MKTDTKKLTTSGLLCALAYMVMLLSKLIPEVAGFLQLDLKDVIIVIGGFILGPVYSVIISAVVALIEMITVSSTGIIGMIMNLISTVAFCSVASFVYSRHRTFGGAIFGLLAGTAMLTVTMLLWNYYITPVYMKVTREVVASMLPTVFLPFNLIKGFINSALTLILYRPLVKSLTKAGLIRSYTASSQGRFLSSALIIGFSVLAVCVPALLYLLGII